MAKPGEGLQSIFINGGRSQAELTLPASLFAAFVGQHPKGNARPVITL